MAEKKDLYKFTIQFNPADPTHRQTADLLNQQGRRKAQFLVNAVMHYIHCPETPDTAPPAILDTVLIETVVRRILKEQRTNAAPANENRESPPKVPSKPSEAIRFEEASDMLGTEGLAAIANTMAMFRNDGG